MDSWLFFDVLLALSPVALAWCVTGLLFQPWPGWRKPLEDGQLCFFAAALSALTIKDVASLDAPSKAADLSELLAPLAGATEICRNLRVVAPVTTDNALVGELATCFVAETQVGYAIGALILCLVIAMMVFALFIAEKARTTADAQTIVRLTVASIAIALITIFVVGGIRWTYGAWP